ncbi:hypothetical protein T492DRAFT_337207 [Pavlovales sp. CCMP2436]|nr:hypothetical protein T492DRAFT_337207 [Pavlovales sp. CCMP2436]
MLDRGRLLELRPPELVFAGVRVGVPSVQTLRVTNPLPASVEFSIRPAASERWEVSPARAHLAPGETVSVQVLLRLTREPTARRGAHTLPFGTEVPAALRDAFLISTMHGSQQLYARVYTWQQQQQQQQQQREPLAHGASRRGAAATGGSNSDGSHEREAASSPGSPGVCGRASARRLAFLQGVSPDSERRAPVGFPPSLQRRSYSPPRGGDRGPAVGAYFAPSDDPAEDAPGDDGPVARAVQVALARERSVAEERSRRVLAILEAKDEAIRALHSDLAAAAARADAHAADASAVRA